MPLQTLHTLAIDDLAFSNSALHTEYIKLVNNLIEIIRDLTSKNKLFLSGSSLSEKYDTNSNEPYLDLLITDENYRYNSRIYIHKNQTFLIKNNQLSIKTNSADEVLNALRIDISDIR